ncbi:MAG: hypothetical protein ACRD4O_17855, partial [Bryobacteraceae bacterium]
MSPQVPVVTMPGPRRRRRRRLWIASSCVVLAVLLGWAFERWFGPGTGRPRARTAIGVLGFKDLAENTGTAGDSQALTAGLAAELGIGQDLRVISGKRMARLKLELNLNAPGSYTKRTLSLMRENTGAEFAVWGQYTPQTTPGGNSAIRLNIVVARTLSGEV